MVKTAFVESPPAPEALPASASFVRFALSGGFCFLVGFALLYVATSLWHIHYLLSTVGVNLLTTALSFTINRRLTFQGRGANFWRALGRYYAVNFGSMALSALMMGALVSGLHVPYLAASVVLALLFCVGNFFFHRTWSFSAS